MKKQGNLIWIDCEFTGIDDYQEHTIIEIAVVITDKDLAIIADPLVMSIHQSDEVLENATEWVKENIPEVLESSRKSNVALAEAEQMILNYLDEHTERGVSPMCGNTIGSDRHMLTYKMPEVEKWCHYRNIDVSTFKELAKRWKPGIEDLVVKKETHHALDDILESIEELKIYREHFIKE